MQIRIPRGWEIPESQVTPEAAVSRRRTLALGAGTIAAAALGGASGAEAQEAMPAMRNTRFTVERPLTTERQATTYNNFYEFGGDKGISSTAQRMVLKPWSIKIDGLVGKPQEIAFEDLLKKVNLEERVLRHRCVEAWAMTVPWTGFPMSELVKLAEPQAGAKYVVFTTATQPATMPGLRQSWYPWPYVDSCTIEEAGNELAFIATGLFGKALPPQNGAPLRVLFPWKYGFKGVKSIVKVTLTDKRPTGYWEALQASEYGFWANVNPDVAHPRWSQASERLLGTGERVPTKIFNGYGDFVAGMYSQLQGERLYV